MKNTIDEVINEFPLLDEHRQNSVKGGTGNPPLTPAQLEQLFDYRLLAPKNDPNAQADGFNSAIGKAFTQAIQTMESTSLGADVLSLLLAKAQSNETLHQIVLTPNAPPTGAYAQYTNQYNSIDLGNLANANLANAQTNANVFQGVVHELWHAFQSNVLNINNLTDTNKTEVTVEADAYIFAALVDEQADALTPGKDYYYWSTSGWVNNSNSTYKTAWNNIMSGSFTMQDYNTIISNFESSGFNGYSPGSTYHPYSAMKTDPVTSLNTNNNFLYFLFQKDFVPALPPATGTTNVGSGGSTLPPLIAPVITGTYIAPISLPASGTTTPTETPVTPTAPTTAVPTGNTDPSTTPTGEGVTEWYNPSPNSPTNPTGQSYTTVVPGQAPPAGFTQFVHSDNPQIQNAYNAAFNDATSNGANPAEASSIASTTATYVENKINNGETPDQIAQDAIDDTVQTLKDMGIIPATSPSDPTTNPGDDGDGGDGGDGGDDGDGGDGGFGGGGGGGDGGGGGGDGGGGGCFIAGTKITMSGGIYKPIETIEIGDTVLSYNTSNTLVEGSVSRLFRYNVNQIINLYAGDLVITTTKDHPFKVGNDFVRVGDLNVGDQLSVFNNGELNDVTLKRKEIINESAVVYNFTVGGVHTYFAENIAVHNKEAPIDDPGDDDPGEDDPTMDD